MPNHTAMRNLKCAFQMTIQRCFPVTHLANHAAKSMYMYECPDLYIVICGAELSDLLTTSAYIPHAAYDCKEAQEMRAPCMFDWQGTQKFFSRWNAKSQIRSLVGTLRNSNIAILSCVHCVIQNAHFELKFKIRNMPSCENSLSGEIDGFW